MAKCPNRKRTKRLANGRGKVGCPGTLQIKFLAALSLPTNRWPKRLDPQDVFDRALFAPVRNHGIRIAARSVLESIRGGRWNLVCPTCGWSLKTPTSARGC